MTSLPFRSQASTGPRMPHSHDGGTSDESKVWSHTAGISLVLDVPRAETAVPSNSALSRWTPALISGRNSFMPSTHAAFASKTRHWKKTIFRGSGDPWRLSAYIEAVDEPPLRLFPTG